MGYGYKGRIKTDFKVLVAFLLFWIVLSSVSFAYECPVQEFKQYAEALDKTQIKSVDRLKENYKNIASEQSKQCRSLLFGDFRRYYDQMTQAYIASVEEKLNEKYPLSAQKEKKYRAEFKKIGLRLDQSEGMYYVEADSAWFLKEFTSSLSDEWKKFLEQSSHEKKNRFMGDDAVMISWEDLEKRVIFWEKFLNDHPDFVKKSTVSDTLLLYSATYLKGSGNSPIYDWDTKKLKSDIRKSYENFLKQNTQSKYFEIVKSQYNIIKEHAFVIDDKVSKKLDDNYKKNIKKIKKKMIDKIKSVYKYVHNADLYQTNIIENSSNLPAPGVGIYRSVTTFSYEWKGGEPYVLRFIARSYTHAAKTYYEEYLFGEKAELIFALSEDEYKISTRYYFEGKSLIRVMKDKKTYDHHSITGQIRDKAVEVIKESKALSTMFNYISNH